MISYIPQEDIVLRWNVISAALGKFWDVGINFETLPNLKRRLLAEDCQLWLWSDDEGNQILFVSEDRQTATARIFTVTHTAALNSTGKPWSRKQLRGMIGKVFTDIEDLAKKINYNAVCIHARPGHVALAEGYKTWNTPIVKKL